MKFRQTSTIRLDDSKAEQVRREHAVAIAELQEAVRSLKIRPGRWEFIARKELYAASPEITIGGLNGDEDREYLLRAYIVTTEADEGLGNYHLRINGAESGLRSFRHYATYALSHGISVDPSAIVLATGGAVGVESFEGVFSSTAMEQRRYEGFARHYEASDLDHWDVVGAWSDRQTPVISLGVRRNGGNIAIGSWFELYRRSPT